MILIVVRFIDSLTFKNIENPWNFQSQVKINRFKNGN